jgi:peptidoglycan/xylan/chitin deacetylase (PgdA/CDA1 family)
MDEVIPKPETLPDPAPRRARFRFLPKTRRGKLLLLAILLVPAFALWVDYFHGTGWSQNVNPVLWYHRILGSDLYHGDEAYLAHGNRDLPEIALTFDDGPHPQSRSKILAILKRYGVHATFFDVGKNMKAHPDLLMQTLAEGHEIANHSDTHRRLDSLNARERHREINDADITYFRLTGKHLELFRPPGMRYTADVLSDLRSMGYITVGYTTASGDFDIAASPDVITAKTLHWIQNGSILLLHDYPGTASALPRIIDTLQARGYRCVTVTELLNHLPERPGNAARAFRQAQEAAEPR